MEILELGYTQFKMSFQMRETASFAKWKSRLNENIQLNSFECDDIASDSILHSANWGKSGKVFNVKLISIQIQIRNLNNSLAS